ncbi:MAG: branched-chain amino acid ABC transporter permease, partial [Candidatus Nanopelagicales bacterium]
MDWGFILTQTMTQAIGITAIIYILAAIGLNVQFGYAGLLNFGQVMFVAAGSYAVGVIVLTFDLSLWLSILVAIVVATLLALLLGIPTLRLRADYLAIVTIAASELFRLSVRSIAFKDTLGGAQGLNGKLGQQFHDTNPLPADFQSLPVLSWTRQD